MRAGVQRATRSFYLNIEKIPANEWLVVFIHEMLHGLDEDLYEALKIQSQEWRWNLYDSKLDSDLAQFLTWIRATLDLGLWGEYRAWYYTLLIYDEGLSEGLWSSIPWIDSAFGKGRDALSVYQSLDVGFVDPEDGFFSNEPVRKMLKQVRTEARRSPPPLGYLSRLFN
jgi:hypothetical protein